MLFEQPLISKRVRKGVTALMYRNGTITIGDGILNRRTFIGYSMQEAIKIWRTQNPAKH